MLIIGRQKEYSITLITKHINDYQDLYVQSATLLLVDAFESFRNKCIKVIDPNHCLPASGLAWQACLKKTGVKLELLTDIDVLLMVEKELEEEYVI